MIGGGEGEEGGEGEKKEKRGERRWREVSENTVEKSQKILISLSMYISLCVS